MHRHIREREKKIPIFMLDKHIFLAVQVLHLTDYSFYELHIDFYD